MLLLGMSPLLFLLRAEADVLAGGIALAAESLKLSPRCISLLFTLEMYRVWAVFPGVS